VDNFCPKLSAILVVGSSSTFVTFPIVTGTGSQTFKITNKGSNGAYLAWGNSLISTVTASASTAVPAANCDYIAAGAILGQDFQYISGPVNTLAAIQDGGSTSLEISLGFGS
jgi:hypothetical protein